MQWWRWIGFGVVCFSAGFWVRSAFEDASPSGSEDQRESLAVRSDLSDGRSVADEALHQDDGPAKQLPPDAGVDALRDLLSEARYERGRVVVQQLLSGYAIEDIRQVAAQVESVLGDLKTIRLRGLLYERWAELDPRALLTHAVDLPSRISFDAVRAALKGLARQSPAAAVDAYRELDHREKWLAGDSIAYALGEVSPEFALKVLEDMPTHTVGAYLGVFDVMAGNDIESALEALASVNGSAERRLATRAIARQWASENWTDAFAWAQDLTNVAHRGDVLAEVMRSAADQGHFDAVIEKLSEIPSISERAYLVGTLINAASHSDPERVWAYLERLDPQERPTLLSSVANSLASADPQRALKFAESLPLGGMRDSFISQAVGRLAAYDLEAAREAFEEVEVGSQRSAATALLEQWSRREPAGAAKFIEAHPGVVADELVGNVASNWTLSDPEGALAWIDQIDDDAKRMAAFEASLQSHARTDPDLATDYVLGIDDPDQRDQLLGRLAKELVSENAEAATQWLRELPEDARNVATGPLVSRTASIDPAEAARLYDDFVQIPGVGIDSGVAGRIGGSWAVRAPGEASRWAAGLEDPEARQAAIETVANSWMKNDPMAASQWVSGLPPGSPRDAATVRLVDHVQNDDPEAGLAWALTIDDAARRQQALEGLTRSWSSRDPASARAALEGASLDAPVHEALIQLVEP